MKLTFSSLCTAFLLAGCAGSNLVTEAPVVKETSPAGPPRQVLAEEIAKTDQTIEEKGGPQEKTTDISEHPTVLIDLNASVQKWIDNFTGPNREAFQRFLNRGSRYRAMVEKSLLEQGVPKEFYYLAMIESGFATHATSSAQAVGIWQFIQGTAQRYGLRANRIVDERRDPQRATKAAAQYLKDLYNVFGSWRLAMAAYNAGEYRILSAIVKGKTRDFWTLAEKRVLPRETMNYVPKFFAAAIIGQEPAKYGFSITDQSGSRNIDLVEVPSPVSLRKVAEETRIPLSDLKDLNPHLMQSMTPSDTSKYGLYFPAGDQERVKLAISRLETMKGSSRGIRSIASPRVHVVKRGETLSSIGKRYGISVAAIKNVNNLSSERVHVGRTLTLSAANSKTESIYRVKPGDTLLGIAARFGLSVSEIRKLNRLRTSSIYSGQPLKIMRASHSSRGT